MNTQDTATNSVISINAIYASFILSPETLFSAIFDKYDFRNLQIDDSTITNGYVLTLSHNQLSLRDSIEQMEDSGYFASVSYTDDQIIIHLNEFGSEAFLKFFIFH